MMVKVNSEYLDFNGLIEIESQVKLFDEIETSNGDYSYSFDIPKTSKNLKILGFPFPDAIKSIYQNVQCEIIDDSGFTIYSGSLQVNSISDVISCTFFSGNTEWFGLLTDPMSSLPLYKYNVDLTVANIQASWLKTSGIVFPLLDSGTVVTRSYNNFKLEDFTGCFYVKTLFKEIFNAQGIKLQGDLLKDDVYNNLLVASNTKNQNDITDRSCYVNKTSSQAISSAAQVTFTDETTSPYFDGSKGNFAASTYTADVKMIVKLDFSAIVSYALARGYVYVYKNGAEIYRYSAGTALLSGQITITKSLNIPLNAYDTLAIWAEQTAGLGSLGVLPNSTFKVTPTFIYKTFGHSSVPNWTQAEFVSNILRLFNVVPSYKVESKTLTLNLFDNIKDKIPVDVSDNITISSIDFTEFISNYAKVNTFEYEEGSDEDLREYNIKNFVSYGAGELMAANDYVENTTDIISSDFTSPITYLNTVFDVSMERINFVEFDEIEELEITNVTDSSGVPRFAISNADDYFTVGDIVRIETTLDTYNGEWVISAVTSTYITVNGLFYDAASSGTATLLRHKFTTDDSVYLFLNVANKDNLFFSSNQSMLIDNTTFTSSSLAYFNLLSNGRQINTKYKQGLSFGTVNDPLSYQQTLLQTYWSSFNKILQDPVMLTVQGYFDRNKFQALKTFQSPVRVKTNDTNNLYYLNRISGYVNSHEPCEAELIKL